MPVSVSVHISHCVGLITGIKPRSVLDVGCGFGLWGFLCREYLDVWDGRVQPEQWQVQIDGIDLFKPYIQAHHHALYTKIHVCDIREAVKSLPDYDLIIAGDVIEHLDKEEGELVLDILYEKARKALLLNIPLGGDWAHPEANGNPGELHRSQWTEDDLVQFPAHLKTFDFGFGQYGVFWCHKDIEPGVRIEALRHAAALREKRGDMAGCLRYLQQANAMAPGHEAAAMQLADVHLRNKEHKRAVDVLRAAIKANPSFHVGRLLLSRLLLVFKLTAEAKQELELLMAQDGVPPEVLTKAVELMETLAEA